MSADRELRNSFEFIQGRLYYVALSAPALAHPQKHFFSIDNELVYWNFFLDFGPLNIGQLYRFCMMLNRKLEDPKLKDKVLYFYSSTHPHKRTNAAYLISSWAMLYNDKSPEDAFRPFKQVQNSFTPWHDATPTLCTFNLTILDTLRGLYKARENRFFNFETFNVDEYEHFEKVENGDLNWCVDGKFIAFAGPHATREVVPSGGYQTLTPENYISYFKRKNVTLVVRLNKKYYDAKSFINNGIDHLDLYFLDGSNPPPQILLRFLQKCEETPGAVAVHCKAGLGRTGTCIAAYIMKHYSFTAEESIAWLRIARPGSVIGPQQQFLKDIQSRMWREGELFRQQQQAARQVSPRTVPALGLRSNPTSPVGDSILPNLKETSPRSARSSGKSNSDVPRSNSSAKLHIDLTRTGSSSSLKVKQPTSARSNKNNGEGSSSSYLVPLSDRLNGSSRRFTSTSSESTSDEPSQGDLLRAQRARQGLASIDGKESKDSEPSPPLLGTGSGTYSRRSLSNFLSGWSPKNDK